MPHRYEIGAVDADKKTGGQELFEVVHRLMSDEGEVGRMDLEIILHPLNIEDLLEIDAKEFAVGFDEDMIAHRGDGMVGGWGCGGGRVEAPVEDLVDGLGEAFEGDGFEQVVDDVEFITFEGIFRIGRREHHERGIDQRLQEVNSAHAGEPDIQEHNIDFPIFEQRQGIGCGAKDAQEFESPDPGQVIPDHVLGQRFIFYDDAF